MFFGTAFWSHRPSVEMLSPFACAAKCVVACVTFSLRAAVARASVARGWRRALDISLSFSCWSSEPGSFYMRSTRHKPGESQGRKLGLRKSCWRRCVPTSFQWWYGRESRAQSSLPRYFACFLFGFFFLFSIADDIILFRDDFCFDLILSKRYRVCLFIQCMCLTSLNSLACTLPLCCFVCPLTDLWHSVSPSRAELDVSRCSSTQRSPVLRYPYKSPTARC
jgi:hypothetical protein